jgi:hypothetical protein
MEFELTDIKISNDCPHCKAKNAAFTTIYYYYIPVNLILLHQIIAKCNLCSKPVIFELQSPDLISSICSQYKYFNNIIKNFIPKLEQRTAPEHVPNDITFSFNEAIRCLDVESYTSVALMMRKVIELTAHQFNVNKGTLYDKINSMSSNNFITKNLAEWAHEIRAFGNEAAHEIVTPSKDDALEIVGFTELFLIYVFTLPGELSLRRQVKNDQVPA